MGHARHPLGGKEGISKTLGNHLQDPRSRHLHPMEPAPSTLGSGGFDPWRRHLPTYSHVGNLSFPRREWFSVIVSTIKKTVVFSPFLRVKTKKTSQTSPLISPPQSLCTSLFAPFWWCCDIKNKKLRVLEIGKYIYDDVVHIMWKSRFVVEGVEMKMHSKNSRCL